MSTVFGVLGALVLSLIFMVWLRCIACFVVKAMVPEIKEAEKRRILISMYHASWWYSESPEAMLAIQTLRDQLARGNIYHNQLDPREAWRKAIEELPKAPSELDRLREIVKRMDMAAPVADDSCDEPGISLSEAYRRQLIDEGHPLFTEGGAA